MKILKIILFLSLFTVFSCSETEKNKHSNPKIILEITSNFQGPWWMNGNVLDFRLFEDGVVEYDEYPLQSKNGQLKAEEVKTLRRVQINETELKEILDLMNSEEFTKVNSEISQHKGCIDAFINTKIEISNSDKSKIISLASHCTDLSDPKSTSSYFKKTSGIFIKDFPQSLTLLFQKIRQIKSRESAGKFYY